MPDPSDHSRKPPAIDRSGRGLTALAETAYRLTRKPFARHGFAESRLLSEWPEIVGPLLGGQTIPERIAFTRGARSDGVLHIRVASGGLATEIAHLELQIVEKVNVYFGFRAVARLAIRQGPLPARPAKKAIPPPPALSPAEEADLKAGLDKVGDESLRTALEALGRRLAGGR